MLKGALLYHSAIRRSLASRFPAKCRQGARHVESFIYKLKESGMRRWLRSIQGALLIACAGGALWTPAQADVAADYKAGFTAYQAGDMVGALDNLRRGAEAGHAPSQVLLADVLDKSEFDEEAVSWYRKAAEQGDSDAEYGLGVMTSSGEGVAKDLVEARRWFLLAASKEHLPSIRLLAHAYLNGNLDFDHAARESPAALEAVKRAADKDYLPALDALVEAYAIGRWGLIPDSGKSMQFRQRASQLRGQAINGGKKKGKR